MKDKCTGLLAKYTGKRHIYYTDRGNTSILLSLKLAKELGKTQAMIQDQGGWITYIQYIRKLKLEPRILETYSGIINTAELEKILDDKTVLIINSMPGYHALQEDMEKIEALCKRKKAFLVNDASGSIGRKEAKYGDIILGSFGEWKPVEVKYGGYIAFDGDYESFFTKTNIREVKDFHRELYPKLESLPEKLKLIDAKVAMIKKQLKDFDILHPESKGLNVIVRFKNDNEKLKLLDFCKAYKYEFEMCPMPIKVMEDAISIEVMRLP